MRQQTRAATLHKGEFQRLIKITRATAKLHERDVLVLMLGHKAGLRITGISRITVADVMFPSGKLREEVSLRAAVTKGCSLEVLSSSTSSLWRRLRPICSTGWPVA